MSFRFKWVFSSVLVIVLFEIAVAAESQHIVLSLSGKGQSMAGAFEDEDLILAGGVSFPRPFLNDQSLALHLGDLNGDQIPDQPGDVDALCFLDDPAAHSVAGRFCFSLQSDQGPIKDGDLIRFTPSSSSSAWEVIVPEELFVSALSAADGNVDLDAVTFLPNGDLVFSLAEDEISGPGQVVITDDTVMILRNGSTAAEVYLTGNQIELMVENALGFPVAPGDVKGLAVHGDELLFTIQSPTAHDATIFSTENGGSIFKAMTELSLGFTGDVEADALDVFSGTTFPSLELESDSIQAGSMAHLTMAGLTPDRPYVLLVSAAADLGGSGLALPGYGTVALDVTDPLFLLGLQNSPALVGLADGVGIGHFSHGIPAGLPMSFRFVIQVMDIESVTISYPVELYVHP